MDHSVNTDRKFADFCPIKLLRIYRYFEDFVINNGKRILGKGRYEKMKSDSCDVIWKADSQHHFSKKWDKNSWVKLTWIRRNGIKTQCSENIIIYFMK